MKNNYRTSQLITYLGNKRSLLPFIEQTVIKTKNILGKEKLTCFDGFSGSGAVARMLKAHSKALAINDLERYSYVSNKCFLTNRSAIDISALKDRIDYYNNIKLVCDLEKGFIEELYAPKNDNDIKAGERVFYTNNNAKIIDNLRRQMRSYDWHCIAPLLYKASVHNNTCGVFKGFYSEKRVKDVPTVGKFGGIGENALQRIKGKITLDMPIFSEYECYVDYFQEDTNQLVKNLYEVDFAYYDPPYNQHPYGSNYFMLNLIADYKRPKSAISRVAGIPEKWNRSSYNKRQEISNVLDKLIEDTPAKIIALSYSSGGFLTQEQIIDILKKYGKVSIEEQDYVAYRAGKNLRDKEGNLTRSTKVKEFLFFLEKK
jgi:adenine-specific DNA-methyltransferase